MILNPRYVRQITFPAIGEEGQKKLMKSHVLIVGCGALGSVLANTLVRAGIGTVRIVDRDLVEENNLQRQILFDEKDAKENLPKAVAAKRKLNEINSSVIVESIVNDLNYTNVETFLEGMDLVLDGTDNFETRLLINDACVKSRKPWIYGSTIGSYGVTQTILPGETPCFRCVYEKVPSPELAGSCETAGILSPVVLLIASIQSIEAFKILTGNRDSIHGGIITIDVWNNQFETVRLGKIQEKKDCVCCKSGRFEFLQGTEVSLTVSLCGRNSIQIQHFSREPIPPVDLYQFAKKIKTTGEVKVNQYLLKAQIDGFDLTLFPDRRAIIQGTDDPVKAKVIYSKYVGN